MFEKIIKKYSFNEKVFYFMKRKPVVAGSFYPSNPERLKEMIEYCFSHKLGPKEFRTRSEVVGGIAPHAGYVYSGPCAAWFYSTLKENKTFIIVGPKHTGYGTPISILTRGEWETPLGTAEIDSEIASYLRDTCPLLKEDWDSHTYEHSIEVHLPFLQYLFEEVKFIPIVIDSFFFDPKYTKKIGSSIKKAKEEFEDIIVIASSDMTHYGPWYGYYPFGLGKNALEKVKELDLKLLSFAEKCDIDGFWRFYVENHMSVCGAGPIIVLLAYSEKEGEVLKYYTSAEVTGDYENFVGYASLVF